jgi:flavin prenyltransferase
MPERINLMSPADTTAGFSVTLALTGASGSLFAAEALQQLHADARVSRIHLIASPSALRVLAEESGVSGRSGLADKLLGAPATKVTSWTHEDIGASIASGSYPVHAMLVLPCSMGTLAGIAHGLADNLIHRAADVCLKERRPLVLCTRETPLNLIHIRNMAAVTEAGATVFPVTPTFYNQPTSVQDIVRNYVHRVLQHMGLPQAGAYQWGADV